LDQTSSLLLDLKGNVGFDGRIGKGKATAGSSILSDWDDLEIVSGSNHPQNYFYNKKKPSVRPSPKDNTLRAQLNKRYGLDNTGKSLSKDKKVSSGFNSNESKSVSKEKI
jgi:hypothetical protein